MTWLLRLLGITPATLFAAGAITVGIGIVALKLYNAGYASADAKWQAIVAQERADQEKASREAGEEAWRAIDRLITELEKRNELIDKLNAEGDADPDAASGGITADSVRRINQSRSP